MVILTHHKNTSNDFLLHTSPFTLLQAIHICISLFDSLYRIRQQQQEARKFEY